jgi:hypothetical protein
LVVPALQGHEIGARFERCRRSDPGELPPSCVSPESATSRRTGLERWLQGEIPMTSTLEHALRRFEVVREGYVVRNVDGSAKTRR